MRIHTSLTEKEMKDVIKAAGAPICFATLEQHGSRTHARAFEVALRCKFPSRSQKNGGQVATWDEWGAFFAALYADDINARCGGSVAYPVYRDAEHFHYSTGSRFVPRLTGSYLPADTHPLHKWEYKNRKGFGCSKCSAIRPTTKQAEAYSPRVYV